MKHVGLIVLFVLALNPQGLGGAESESVWKSAAAGYAWDFPRDLAFHPDYKTEWWYITGHLQLEDDAQAEPLGYQLTFFRSALAPRDSLANATAWDPEDLIMAHAAISDPNTGTHTFSEVIWRTTPFLGGFGSPGEERLAWCRAPAGTDAQWQLDWRNGSFHLGVRDDAKGLRFDLECTPTRPRVFHGQQGFSPKTAEGKSGSLYFSQTRMQTTGTVFREGRAIPVRGSSWLDREIFTSSLGENQKGWDWAALGLDDGRDIMLYSLRDQSGEQDFASGTLVDGNGSRPLAAEQWDLTALEHWTSEDTGSKYPVRWKLSLPDEGLDLLIRAVLPDQENVSERTGIHYWEGAVTVHPWDDRNRMLGRGFVELTGYGKGSRPPI
jgi:predicted secreted hydrolase